MSARKRKLPTDGDVLTLVPATRTNARGRIECSYLDIAINRRPLPRMAEIGDYVSVFGWLKPGDEATFARQLLLREPSGLPSGRVPLYVCPMCADLGCGCVSVHVAETEDCFVWSDAGVETSYQAGFDPLQDVRDFYFAKEPYRSLLSPLAHRRR